MSLFPQLCYSRTHSSTRYEYIIVSFFLSSFVSFSISILYSIILQRGRKNLCWHWLPIAYPLLLTRSYTPTTRIHSYHPLSNPNINPLTSTRDASLYEKQDPGGQIGPYPAHFQPLCHVNTFDFTMASLDTQNLRPLSQQYSPFGTTTRHSFSFSSSSSCSMKLSASVHTSEISVEKRWWEKEIWWVWMFAQQS